MTPTRNHSRTERLLMAFVALLFLLQPMAQASELCGLRARFLGKACCCTEETAPAAASSCCSKNDSHPAAPEKRAPKHCGCQVSAPTPLVPPAGSTYPPLLSSLAWAASLPLAPITGIDPAAIVLGHDPPLGSAPPLASSFHRHLASSLARALAFVRSLRS